jgi:murein DD-endopeptidase MepM/ murein hydrolase activator NlpD
VTRGRLASVLAAGLMLAARALTAPASAAGAPPEVTWHPAVPRPGDVAWFEVRGVPAGAAVAGWLGDRALVFFPHGGGQAALVGFDLDLLPGPVAWRVVATAPGQPAAMRDGHLRLEPREFSVQRLTLPPSMVDLDPATERRALDEAGRLRALYATSTPARLWRERFVRPVAGNAPGTGFGARRVINGKPRAPHAGVDYAAPWGTPVVAANDGRVALVADFFFPGRLVILDHGLGLYTLYFHLEAALVVEGERVSRGQPIGTVGATGRATGPHLHFGVQVGPARVDPDSLLGLEVGE